MHDIEHKSAQEEPASTPEQKGITTTGRQKLPRAWRYVIIGATVLLVLAVIFAGVLALTNQRAKQSPIAGTTPTTGTSTLVGNTVYVGAANGMAYALHAGNGKVLWHYLTDVTG